MKKYAVRVTGETPLLMHHDNIAFADEMEAWQRVPENKANSKAGDDRTPAWRWIGSLYHDDEHICIPHDLIQPCLMKAGAQVPTGRGKKTFKQQTQSGIVPLDTFCKLEVGGKLVATDDVLPLREEPEFAKHVQRARELGFSLFIKRAVIGRSKHVRVRPRFDSWAFTVNLGVVDEQITRDVLAMIFDRAGFYVGIGDWRPSAPSSPGPFGRFNAEVMDV